MRILDAADPPSFLTPALPLNVIVAAASGPILNLNVVSAVLPAATFTLYECGDGQFVPPGTVANAPIASTNASRKIADVTPIIPLDI